VKVFTGTQQSGANRMAEQNQKRCIRKADEDAIMKFSNCEAPYNCKPVATRNHNNLSYVEGRNNLFFSVVGRIKMKMLW